MYIRRKESSKFLDKHLMLNSASKWRNSSPASLCENYKMLLSILIELDLEHRQQIAICKNFLTFIERSITGIVHEVIMRNITDRKGCNFLDT